jgi:hypothetical protein
MGKPRKKYPEFELPPLLANAITEYLGPAQMVKLHADQRKAIMALAAKTAGELGDILILEVPTD